MEERFFVEDTVVLKEDPSIYALVDQTWRDIDSGGLSKPDDLICHSGVSKALFKQCLSEGRPPAHHVVISFLDPHVGFTVIKESALILKDRGLVVGDVVKRSPSDAESGYVIKTSLECTIQPIYTELPWNSQYGWPHKAEDCRLRVPADELTFLDFQAGDYVLYRGWIGEVADFREEVKVKLENGSVVRVNDSDALESLSYPKVRPIAQQHRRSIVETLKEDQNNSNNDTPDVGELTQIDVFYPGLIVFTKKSNLRLGAWAIGSYNPSVKPRGIVVEHRVTELMVDWMTYDVYGHAPDHPWEAPPETLTTDELDQVKLYNRNNISTNSGLASDKYGSRQGHDIGAGDYVKFRDITAAAVKYSENSSNALETGMFRRVPRQMTLGFDFNTFLVRETTQTVSVQWQDGSVTTSVPSSQLIPYLNVDEHDLWVGEICSMKSEETKKDGLIQLHKVGVVQSVDAKERTVVVRWFQNPKVAIFEETITMMEPGSSLGKLRRETEQVSIYEVIAYPALTKRRGDIVLIAPNDRAHAVHHAEALKATGIPHVPPSVDRLLEEQVSSSAQTLAPPPDDNIRWLGEVVDLGTDGLLTIRLGGNDLVEDIKMSVTRLTVVAGGDDDEDMFSHDDFDDDPFDDDDDEEFDTEEGIDTDDMDSNPDNGVIKEVTYEGGQRLDDGDEDDWEDENENDGEDEDQDQDQDKDKDRNMDGSIDGEEKDLANGKAVRQLSDSDVTMNDAQPAVKPVSNAQSESHLEYDFESLVGMPEQFDIISEDPPSDHHFFKSSTILSSNLLRRIRKEHGILSSSLPAGIWVRTWDQRLDLLRILIIGPRGTPYELAPFVLDVQFGSNFPVSPPAVHFHSWTYGVGRINPNLYEGGKVCLSVLGTWPEGDSGEGWNKDKSSVLQVLVSLMGLVLVKQPYYNEAGFEALVGTEESILPSQLYTEKAYCMSKGFIAHALSHDIVGLDSVLTWLYLDKSGPQLLKVAVEESKAKVAKGEDGGDQDGRLSTGAKVLINKHLRFLEQRLTDLSTGVAS